MNTNYFIRSIVFTVVSMVVLVPAWSVTDWETMNLKGSVRELLTENAAFTMEFPSWSEGPKSSVSKSIFSSQGYITETTNYGVGGSPSTITTFIRDGRNNVIEEHVKNPSGQLLQKTLTSYDNMDRILEHILEDGNGVVQERWVYTYTGIDDGVISHYDSQGNLLDTTEFETEGNQVETSFYDAQGNLKARTVNISHSDTFHEMFNYDENNTFVGRQETFFNANGDISEQKLYDDADSQVSHTIYEYVTFDSVGNWTKRVSKLKLSDDFGGFDINSLTPDQLGDFTEIPQLAEYRSFTYDGFLPGVEDFILY